MATYQGPSLKQWEPTPHESTIGGTTRISGPSSTMAALEALVGQQVEVRLRDQPDRTCYGTVRKVLGPEDLTIVLTNFRKISSSDAANPESIVIPYHAIASLVASERSES